MNRHLDELRYQNRSTPLEKRLTFNDLQARNVGFQSPIPVDSTLEQMNSLAFKSMEGQCLRLPITLPAPSETRSKPR